MAKQLDWLLLVHVDPALRLPRELVIDEEPHVYLDDEEVYGELEEIVDPQTGFTRYML